MPPSRYNGIAAAQTCAIASCIKEQKSTKNRSQKERFPLLFEAGFLIYSCLAQLFCSPVQMCIRDRITPRDSGVPQLIELTIAEAGITEDKPKTDNDSPAAEPMVLISCSEQKEPLAPGGETELTVSFRNLSDLCLLYTSCRKSLPYNGSAHIPMFISGPERFIGPRGRVDNSLVELRDVMPTLLNLAGAPIPKHLDGQSMLRPVERDLSLIPL